MGNNRFFARHAKSSAALISLGIHALFLVVAITFVAVKVITKNEQAFEAKPITRPKMQLKKLQVPVTVKKKRPKPKLRKRIVAKPRQQAMPDIQMPEITGIKGGLGNAGGDGLGAAAGVGFSMPEIEVFGVRSRGEKIFIALDSDQFMMKDKLGGVLAYQIIKAEVIKILEGLSSTTLFNLAIFEHHSASTMFPQMVPATDANVNKVKEWLEPLNEFVEGRGGNLYGVKTLGKGGVPIKGERDYKRGNTLDMTGPKCGQHWYTVSAVAMEQQADTVFILSGWWGVLRAPRGKWPEWPEKAQQFWQKKLAEARAMQAEENKKRAARGEPPQVTRDDNHLMWTWFGKDNWLAWKRPEPPWYSFTGKDFANSLKILREEFEPKTPRSSGISSRKKKKRFDVNVIYFAEKGSQAGIGGESKFEELARSLNGKFRRIEGLEEIKSSVAGGGN